MKVSHRKRDIVADGPVKEKTRCPRNFLRLFGIRKMRVSAEEQRVRDGM